MLLFGEKIAKDGKHLIIILLPTYFRYWPHFDLKSLI